MDEKILSLDLGKSKSVACILVAEKDARPAFVTVPTRPQDLHDLVAEHDPDVVIMEVCSTACWVHRLVLAMDKRAIVTATNGPSWKWKNARLKNDRNDALKMIKMYQVGELEPVYMPTPEEEGWRLLIGYRHEAVRQQTALKNRIRSTLAQRGIDTPRGSACWTIKHIEELEAMSRPVETCGAEEMWRAVLHETLACHKLVKAQIDRLDTALERLASKHEAVELLRRDKGVGPRLAEAVVAAIGDPLRFKRGKQVGCYAGLTPRQWESGQISRDGHISKQGNRLLRTMLVEVAWIGLKYQPWMREMYERVKKNTKKRSKLAIVAVARKLLIRLWARWRDHERAKRAGQPLPAA
jgi:transposase